jgi:6,7-dimethyl-8-ribityllumazine synthase
VSKRLLRGAVEALKEHGVETPRVHWVPTAFDLPVAALTLAERGVDAIVCLACLVPDETTRSDLIAAECASGLMQVQLETGVPCAYGVLTTLDLEQAQALSGPKRNRGREAAEAAVEMVKLLRQIQGPAEEP